MLSHDFLEANAQIQANEALGVGLLLSAGLMEVQRSFTEQMEAQEAETPEAQTVEEIVEEMILELFEELEMEEEIEVVKVRCCILLEDVPITECLCCPAGHALHVTMTEPFIGMEFDKDFDTLKANRGQLKCPFENCEEHFQHDELERIVSPEVFGKILKMKQRFDDYSTFLADLETGQETMEESVRQQFKKADGSYSGFACPRCKYGPIDKKACDDLTAHQGQRIASGVHISNKCPQCFYFDHSIHNWRVWDGKFLSAQELADIRDYREQAAKDILESMEESKKRLCDTTIRKRNFKNRYGFHARSMLLAEIRGNTIPELGDDDEEDLDLSDDLEVLEGAELDSHQNPVQNLIRQIENANGPEKTELSKQMEKTLLRSKTSKGNVAYIKKWQRLNRDQKRAGNDFIKSKQDYETAISNAMAAYTVN